MTNKKMKDDLPLQFCGIVGRNLQRQCFCLCLLFQELLLIDNFWRNAIQVITTTGKTKHTRNMTSFFKFAASSFSAFAFAFFFLASSFWRNAIEVIPGAGKTKQTRNGTSLPEGEDFTFLWDFVADLPPFGGSDSSCKGQIVPRGGLPGTLHPLGLGHGPLGVPVIFVPMIVRGGFSPSSTSSGLKSSDSCPPSITRPVRELILRHSKWMKKKMLERGEYTDIYVCSSYVCMLQLCMQQEGK
jgi:hypothetical protein